MIPGRYLNFDLRIERLADGYVARARSPEGDEASQVFAQPFTDAEYAALVETPPDFGGGASFWHAALRCNLQR